MRLLVPSGACSFRFTDFDLLFLVLNCSLSLSLFWQDVDEKLLYDTFLAFGVIATNPKVQCTLTHTTPRFLLVHDHAVGC